MKTFKQIGNFQIQPQNAEHRPRHQDVSLTRDESPAINLYDLPESVLVYILQGLHIRDILSLRQVNSFFCTIIDHNYIIWASLSFAEVWPNEKTLCQFLKAAQRKNLEAVIKLAVAYLYKEEITGDDMTVASKQACHYLCQAERLTPKTFPFFWIFIRPPWSPEGLCCKMKTFQYIKDTIHTIDHPDITFGTALILKLQRLATAGGSTTEEEAYFQKAIGQKSSAAAFFSLMDEITVHEPEKAKELEKVRLLRHIAAEDILEAKLNLIRYYTQGLYGGISREKAQEYVRDFFLSAEPSGIHIIYSGSQTSDVSRYILIDWLVEVVGMKDFSAHVLYFAVSLFDRFLQVRSVQRSQVQLLGVAAIVVSSRFLGFDILTIREAAWLTDNSYSYYDVVKMMGELVAVLRGNLRALTIQDYTKVLLSLVNETGYAGVLTEYLSMLCLLQAEMGQYSPAEIAASCLLLARILLNCAESWPTLVQEWTGFTQDYLSLCTFHIYNKCLVEGSQMEYRDTILQAVKTRYADPLRYSVSSIKLVGHKDLCSRLGVTKLIAHGKETKAIKFRNTDELIMSPRNSLKSEYHCSVEKSWLDRDKAATPPVCGVYVMDENISGYEGDLEYESDDSLDQSELLIENLDLSAIGADNREWSSVQEDVFCPDDQEPAMPVYSNVNETETDVSKIACLSSMCQSGDKMACHSPESLPSSCISNCSCKRYSLGLKRQSQMSISSPSLSTVSSDFLSSSALLPPSNPGHAQACLPCGNLSSAATRSRKVRLLSYSEQVEQSAQRKRLREMSSTDADISEITNVVVSPMRKAYSSQSLATSSCPKIHIDSSAGVCFQSCHNDNFTDLAVTNDTPDYLCFLPETDSTERRAHNGLGLTGGAEVNICLRNCDTVLATDSLSSSGYTSSMCYKLPGDSPETSDTAFSPPQDASNERTFMFSLVSAANSSERHENSGLEMKNITSYERETRLASFDCDTVLGGSCPASVGHLGSIHTAATPELTYSLQKFCNKESGLMKGSDTFSCSTLHQQERSPSRYVSKRARLDKISCATDKKRK